MKAAFIAIFYQNSPKLVGARYFFPREGSGVNLAFYEPAGEINIWAF